jgi:hypothetical protein
MSVSKKCGQLVKSLPTPLTSTIQRDTDRPKRVDKNAFSDQLKVAKSQPWCGDLIEQSYDGLVSLSILTQITSFFQILLLS